ncbi:DUF397 domain-containing protein [Kutzneria sp. CA-103260]|uniref:DUF397 domain-containing protein n=1 Tax=Kutzneria sp. CA-103260 TaxID=2802641 RepID=UPI001BAD7EF7|nr:DUF397 domain-containing protein [Kutzneria sp. CA-103260]QUQ68249.1 hypothetical protein JJ691_59940 [Kutzneria sp. CA-103260]
MSEFVWRKSSKSPSQQCVEIAHDQGDVLVRDSKQRSGPVLRFPAEVFLAFVKVVDGQHHGSRGKR